MQDDLFGAPPAPAPPPTPAAPATVRAPRATRPTGVQPADASALQPLAAQLPAGLRMGVSTWSYPGWASLVWDGVYDASQLSKHGLGAYAQHPLLRTVCVDRSFWRPLTTAQYQQMAGQVPADFRFVVKCPAVVTDAQVRSEEGRGQQANPAFLDPGLALSAFVQPALEGLGDKLGVLVFQLSPLPWELLRQPRQVLARLHSLLAAVQAELQARAAPPAVTVAVELRNPELIDHRNAPDLVRAFIDTLRATGATYCLGLHGKLPPIEEQLPLLRALWPGPLVCRWNLNRRFGPYGYEDAQVAHTPFDQILSPDPHTRAVLAQTIAGITGRGQPAFVTISNDAEGCAPRSIALLAEAVAARRAGADGAASQDPAVD